MFHLCFVPEARCSAQSIPFAPNWTSQTRCRTPRPPPIGLNCQLAQTLCPALAGTRLVKMACFFSTKTCLPPSGCLVSVNVLHPDSCLFLFSSACLALNSLLPAASDILDTGAYVCQLCSFHCPFPNYLTCLKVSLTKHQA